MRKAFFLAALLYGAACLAQEFPIQARLGETPRPNSTLLMSGPNDKYPSVHFGSRFDPFRSLTLTKEQALRLWEWVNRFHANEDEELDPSSVPSRRVLCRFRKSGAFKWGYLKRLILAWDTEGVFRGAFAVVRVRHHFIHRSHSEPLELEVPLTDLDLFHTAPLGIAFGEGPALPITVVEATPLETRTGSGERVHRIRVALTSDLEEATRRKSFRVALFEVLSHHSFLFMADPAVYRAQLERALRREWTPDESIELDAARVAEVTVEKTLSTERLLQKLKEVSQAHPHAVLRPQIEFLDHQLGSYRDNSFRKQKDDLFEPWQYLLAQIPLVGPLPSYSIEHREPPYLPASPAAALLDRFSAGKEKHERPLFSSNIELDPEEKELTVESVRKERQAALKGLLAIKLDENELLNLVHEVFNAAQSDSTWGGTFWETGLKILKKNPCKSELLAAALLDAMIDVPDYTGRWIAQYLSEVQLENPLPFYLSTLMLLENERPEIRQNALVILRGHRPQNAQLLLQLLFVIRRGDSAVHAMGIALFEDLLFSRRARSSLPPEIIIALQEILEDPSDGAWAASTLRRLDRRRLLSARNLWRAIPSSLTWRPNWKHIISGTLNRCREAISTPFPPPDFIPPRNPPQ